MDNCCFNRIFDDRSYPSIYFDRNSVILILELVEKKQFNLYGSQMLIKEILDTPDIIKREQLKLIYSLCFSEIKVTNEIAERAIEIRKQSNIRTKDSIHLACAESVNVDVFLTVDKKFKNNANRIPSKIKVMSPTEWLMEVIL
jgi:predicted nucleic acid-binding protein